MNVGTRFYTFSGMILLAALSRVLPHPPNFAPITAMAIFAGAYLTDKRLACAVPLAAMLISDIVLEITTGWGFYDGMWTVYSTLALITTLGFALRGRVLRGQLRPLDVAATTLTGSLLFFVLTNAAVWAFGSMYPHTGTGLVACYTAALPFFGNSLLGDLCYAALLFGGFALAERRFSALRLPASEAVSRYNS